MIHAVSLKSTLYVVPADHMGDVVVAFGNFKNRDLDRKQIQNFTISALVPGKGYNT